MFKFCRASQTVNLYDVLKGVVRTSLVSVEVGTLTSFIHNSAQKLVDSSSGTASASDEMLSTVQGISENAQQAATLAQTSSSQVQDAVRGMTGVQNEMGATVASIMRLKETSGEIQDILKTISDISSQTNLLALNAAIESARAGEAGRGFAVVADEVRKLSVKTQQSTEEITRMVQQIQEDVTIAVTAVKKSETALDEGTHTVKALEASSSEIEDLMGSIARSIQEQTLASQQISEGITYVSSVAAENLDKTAEIMRLIDALLGDVEAQRATLAEAPIPHKILLLAQADHAFWKKKIVDFDMGRLPLEPQDAGDHVLCRLGKWYYGQGKKDYGAEEAFKEMEAAHIRVHQAAREAVERRQKDRNADLSDLIEDIAMASDAVVHSLQALD